MTKHVPMGETNSTTIRSEVQGWRRGDGTQSGRWLISSLNTSLDHNSKEAQLSFV